MVGWMYDNLLVIHFISTLSGSPRYSKWSLPFNYLNWSYAVLRYCWMIWFVFCPRPQPVSIQVVWDVMLCRWVSQEPLTQWHSVTSQVTWMFSCCQNLKSHIHVCCLHSAYISKQTDELSLNIRHITADMYWVQTEALHSIRGLSTEWVWHI